MSRSFKHTPVTKDGERSVWWNKRQANKAVRRYLKRHGDMPDGVWYRKVYSQYDIHDCVSCGPWPCAAGWNGYPKRCAVHPGREYGSDWRKWIRK